MAIAAGRKGADSSHVETQDKEQRKIRGAGTLPEAGFLRLKQIIGDPRATPPIPALIPVGRSSWWAGVRSGRFPKPVKLGPRTTAWTLSSILALIQSCVPQGDGS
ncbi:MAG TPA: AlpA family phage regulatory protein [Bradyrhizobium sp.]|nr:AlpA family phage regulatory protein [Bradyrhizobium sp.]